MMRRVYVVLAFFFLLFFVGCEKEEFPSGVQSHRQPEGFVQSRVDDDGVRHVALIVAPKRPGERPPDLSSLKGIDFLERSRSEVRARLDPDRVPRYPGFAFYRPGTYLLSSPFSVSIYPGENGFLTNDPEHEDPYVYSSDYYILYDLYSEQEEQELTFSRGDIEGKVFLRRDGGALYARFNDEPGESRIFHGGGSSNPTARISFVLPLGFFRGLDRETLNRYVGEWTVSGNPELPPFGINGPGTGGTPFSFDIRAFIVDEISGAYRPDIPVPDSDETVSGGAMFRAVAKTLADGPDGVEGNLHWKAVVLPPGGGDTIRTLYGQSGTYSPGGTGIEVNWDGKNESGQTVPGGKKYGINISAVVTENTPPQPIRGRVWHNAFGPPEANVNPYNIEISPNPYIPYTHEEMHFEIDEDGFPVWPDDDGDGYPDRFPDHDGDGYPDFNPGEEPPGIHFYADPNRGGYETTWTAEVVSEEGEVLHTESSPRTNAEVDFEWMPPAELEPQTLKLRVSATQCQRRKVEVGVLGRGAGGGCESFAFEGEVAFGEKEGLLEIFAEDSGQLLATSEAPPPEVVAGQPDSPPVFGGLSGRVDFHGTPNNSFIQKVPGTDYRVILSVSKVPRHKRDADDLVIKLRTTESSGGASRNIELFPGTHPKTGERCFLRIVRLSNTNSGGDEPRFAIEPFADSFSSLDSTGSHGRLQDSEAFIGIQQELGRRQLGVSHDFPEHTSSYQMTTPVGVDAFRAAGYESLVAEYEGEECWVRVRNQARVFYVSAHGLHDQNFIQFDSGGIIFPSSDSNEPNGLIDRDWKNDKLGTVIFAACSVLDCGNWNQGQHGRRFSLKNPGLAWANITKPSTILLGYNAAAPDAEFGEVGAKRDTRIVELFYEQIGRGDHPTLAWLRANARMETRLGDNASAIFGDYYYFIKFERRRQLFGGFRHTKRQIWKVHHSYWDGEEDFEKIDSEVGHRIKLQDLPDQAEGEDHGAF